MGEVMGNAVFARALMVTSAFTLTIGGVVLAVGGALNGNAGLIVGGVVGILLGQALHIARKALHQARLLHLAEDAAAGSGPVPPPEVRAELLRRARARQPRRADLDLVFGWECRAWAQAHRNSPVLR